MSADRSIALSPRQRLHKRAAKALVEAVGGVEAAAEFCRAGKSQLSDYGNANVATFMPSDVIADLEALVPEPAVTRMLARAAGCELLRLPEACSAGGPWAGFVAELAKEMGELVSGVCQDLADDNDLSPQEASRRLSDAADLVRVAVNLEAALKARADER